jgi:hypothetical protein
VGVAAWHARGAASLHGVGWRRCALPAWCVSALGSWPWSEVGHADPGWRVAAEGDGLLCVGLL